MKKLLMALGAIACVTIQAGQASIPEKDLQGSKGGIGIPERGLRRKPRNGQVSIPEKDLHMPVVTGPLMDKEGNLVQAISLTREIYGMLPTLPQYQNARIAFADMQKKLQMIQQNANKPQGEDNRERLRQLDEIMNMATSRKLQNEGVIFNGDLIRSYQQAKSEGQLTPVYGISIVNKLLQAIKPEIAKKLEDDRVNPGIIDPALIDSKKKK